MHFSPTQKRIVELLSDGMLHSKEELYGLLLTANCVNHVQMHISNIRKVLRPVGQDIICTYKGTLTFYRLVRYLNRQ
jgi:hypothetical protein